MTATPTELLAQVCQPRSDQFNADDLLAEDRRVRVRRVVFAPGQEQQTTIHLDGETRAWRPPPTVCRVLLALWGPDPETWIGQEAMLYRDGTVRSPADRKGDPPSGGIRVSAVTGIDRPATVPVQVSRGQRAHIRIDPLTRSEPQAPPTLEALGLTVDLFDAWRSRASKPPWGSLTPHQQQQLLVWLAASPARAEEVRG